MKREKADLLIKDATVYTADKGFSKAEAFAVSNGKIVGVGRSADMIAKYDAKEEISFMGKFIYPGWNDAHCHFLGYGLTLNEVDLMGTTSPEEIVERCRLFVRSRNNEEAGNEAAGNEAVAIGQKGDTEYGSRDWITGRGWDQNDWENTAFPGTELLDEAFPDTPVYLRRIDGHAAWVNTTAIQLAGITASTRVEGGEVLLESGQVKGILIDNAMNLVEKLIPVPGIEAKADALLKAEKNCFAVGLTSVSDAGLSAGEVALIDSMQQVDALKMRINAWLTPSEENYTSYVEKGPSVNEHLSIRTIKLYADGALGSRGALLLEDYADDPGNKGILVTSEEELREHCRKAFENGYQVAVHCIGDGANRLMLNIYSEFLEPGNDLRWRIEHAQIIHPADLEQFGKYSIVPSVQPTHATSDMYWAVERLGDTRLQKGAYSYKTLMNQLGWIPNGSDFPVEDINPLYGFYAAVARKDQSGYPDDRFIPEEALSREQALLAMTSWAAKAAFEETFKGSIAPGMVADFVVTGEDIMTIPEAEIPHVKVLETWSDGKKVFSRK